MQSSFQNEIPTHILNELYKQAYRSELRCQHGCVITKGKQIISTATNDEIYHSESKAIIQSMSTLGFSNNNYRQICLRSCR